MALYNIFEAAGVKTDQEQTACKMDWANLGLDRQRDARALAIFCRTWSSERDPESQS